MFTDKWEAQFTRKMFKDFKRLCKEIEFDVPKDILKLAAIDSYDFCEHLKQYQIPFESIELASKCVHLDKYYVDKLISFPSLYLCESADGKDYSKMTEEERAHFEQMAEKTVYNVCRNQAELFNYDPAIRLLDTHFANWQERNGNGEIENDGIEESDIGRNR